jgi:hypothetical protein
VQHGTAQHGTHILSHERVQGLEGGAPRLNVTDEQLAGTCA